MSVTDRPPAAPPPSQGSRRRARHEAGHAPRGGGLLRAELHRFAARRFIQLLLLLAVAGYAVTVPLVAWTQFARTTPELRAQAQQEIDRLVAESERFRQDCLTQPLPPDVPEGTTVEDWCGPPADPSQFSPNDFLPKASFDVAEALQPGALAVGVAVAALFFVVGATWIGAEWNARTMMALLFWETRRLRVLLTKAVVLVLAAALFSASAQAVWIGSAFAIGRLRGTTGPLPATFWPDVAALGGRLVLVAVLVALIGFGVAHLIRSTGAALGVGFVYFAVVETAVQGVRPAWSEWLLSTNVAALAVKGGTTIFVPGTTVDDESGQFVEFVERNVSNLHGGLVIGTVTLLLLVVGAVVFRRRDLT